MNRTILTICLAAATFTACQTQKTAERPLTAVRTVAAELTTVSNEIRYSGIVAPDTQVDLAFRVSGYVTRIGTAGTRELQEGDFVSAGTILAQLRTSEYQSKESYAQAVAADATASLAGLRAQLSEAEASLAQATSDFERASSLFAEKALTKADFDAAEARRATASARRESAVAQIAAQQARIEGAGAQRRDAAINLGDTTITAPFPGVILAKKIARGSLATAGAPAFVIADTRVAKVSFGVPDMALAGFRSGEALTVTTEAMPNRTFRGHISSIAAAADSASRVFAVEVSIPNPAQALKIGMVATVVVAGLRDTAPRPSIPLAAVVKPGPAQGEYGVYAIDNDRVRLQPVSLGPVRGDAVVVTAGLIAGQRIVATAGLQLSDGERVRQIP
jgi:multidrug efflux pump subunit AcrA (membrane-fusion protein)